MPTLAPSTWRPVAWPFNLPGRLANLGDGLRGNGFPETRRALRGIDRDPPADRCGAAAQQLLCLAPVAQTEMFVPVEFECGREVVDLRQRHVVGSIPASAYAASMI